MILSDREIMILMKAGELIIEPFTLEIVRENGLDLRLGTGYCRFKETTVTLDPKNPVGS